MYKEPLLKCDIATAAIYEGLNSMKLTHALDSHSLN